MSSYRHISQFETVRPLLDEEFVELLFGRPIRWMAVDVHGGLRPIVKLQLLEVRDSNFMEHYPQAVEYIRAHKCVHVTKRGYRTTRYVLRVTWGESAVLRYAGKDYFFRCLPVVPH